MRILPALSLATGLLCVDAPRASAFDALVIFGDSLSDTGNAGRFSNGSVWVEGLAERLALSARPSNAGGANYAIGGARLNPASGPSSLPAQLARHLQAPREAGHVLHVVYGGGNDLIAAALDPAGARAVDAAASALADMLTALAERGATDILVPNLPDVGMTPAARGRPTAALAHAAGLTRRFNARLDTMLTEIEGRFPVRLHRLDVYAMAERARRDPSSFGFANVTTPCAYLPSCEGHLFWDGVHPTAQAHARLAEAAAQLFSVP